MAMFFLKKIQQTGQGWRTSKDRKKEKKEGRKGVFFARYSFRLIDSYFEYVNYTEIEINLMKLAIIS